LKGSEVDLWKTPLTVPQRCQGSFPQITL
jgi:hypothetical protein